VHLYPIKAHLVWRGYSLIVVKYIDVLIGGGAVSTSY
jgi:hypothetical protein